MHESVDQMADAIDNLLANFSKMKLADKIDTAAKLKAIAKILEEIDTKVKDLIKAKRKPDELEWEVLGRFFKAKGAVVACERLDQKRLKEHYHDIYKDCLTPGKQDRILYQVR